MATGSKRVKWSLKRLKGCLICNSPFFLSFDFMPSSPHPHHPCSPPSFTSSHSPGYFTTCPCTHLLRPPCFQILPALSTLLTPLVSARLERSGHSEMLLRAMISWTLKSLLRGDKFLSTSVLNQTDISLESLRISATPRSCTENMRSHKQAKASREGNRGFPGATLELLLPGTFTREK